MFITIDGPDGVGKTTISKALVDLLNEKSPTPKAVYTSEPTDSELGQKIRAILKSSKSEEIAKLAELFVEDRANHVQDILSWLKNGKTVVCDRYKYSTIVYQQLQGENIEKLIAMNSPFREPDFAFVLNVENVDTLLAHISKRGLERDLFETSLTLRDAIKLYNDIKNHYENAIYIDAEQEPDRILADILRHLGNDYHR